MTKRVVIPISISNNIGNAFFAMGLKWQLEATIPDSEVTLLCDQPAYWNMLPGRSYRTRPKNSLGFLDFVRPDYIALAGSVLTEQFPRIWGRSLEILTNAGVKVLLMGVGQYEYSQSEIDVCRELLRRYPPLVLVSRDHLTFKNFSGLAEHSYDGIDGAYFVDEQFVPLETELPPYMILNFDKGPEPTIAPVDRNTRMSSGDNQIVYSGQHYLIRFPRILQMFATVFGKGFGHVLSPFGVHGSRQSALNEFKVVRTDHQVNPISIKRIFRGPNSFASDIPDAYLNLYSHTEFTLTDRIHAALVTMLFGNEAMLFSKSGRALIIERIGVEYVTRQLSTMNKQRLVDEKQAQIEFLRNLGL